MKEMYEVQMMTSEHYDNYMCGSHNYRVEYVRVFAENKEEALALVKEQYPTHQLNKNYVLTVAELERAEEEERQRIEERNRKEEEKQARAKARKEERELAEAMEKGITVEELRIEKKRAAKIRKAERELHYALSQVEKAKKFLKWAKEEYLIKK